MWDGGYADIARRRRIRGLPRPPFQCKSHNNLDFQHPPEEPGYQCLQEPTEKIKSLRIIKFPSFSQREEHLNGKRHQRAWGIAIRNWKGERHGERAEAKRVTSIASNDGIRRMHLPSKPFPSPSLIPNINYPNQINLSSINHFSLSFSPSQNF